MPKEDKLWRKLKKIEEKLKKRIHRVDSSSSVSTAEDQEMTFAEPEISIDKENTGIQENKDSDELDKNILTALGNPSTSDKPYANEIHPEIIRRIENILVNGINKEVADELYKKYLVPKNLLLLEPPKLNIELVGLLSDSIKDRDKRVEERQQQLGVAIAALLTVLDNLIKDQHNIQTIETLTDVSRLLCDLHFNDTCTRRKLIAVNLDKDVIKTTDTAKRDSFLFGEKFNENVKSANAIKKAAPTILKKIALPRKPVQVKQTYQYYKNKENSNPPLHKSRVKQGRGGRYQPRPMRQHQQKNLPGKTHNHRTVRQT